MKKTLVKVSLLSMMLSLMPVAMTSCKDYDDDIKEINGTTGELSSQIAALQAAIEANKESAKAAHDAAEAAMQAAKDAEAKGDQAEADAQKAMAMAKAAEEAAANAKAEALAEIAAQVKILNDKIGSNADAIQANKDAISALVGRIEGVEKGLAAIDIDGLNESIKELNTALEAVNVQLAALAGYESRLNELESQYSGLKSEVAEMKEKIESMRSDLAAAQDDIVELFAKVSSLGGDITELRNLLNTLSGRVDGIDGNISEILAKIADIVADVEYNQNAISENSRLIGQLRADLNELSEKISTEVQNGINTIAGVISARLTSVTLMPDLYVDGIPTIEFKSAQYNALKWQNGNWVESTNVYRVSNNETEVEYRLNPGTVGNEDININNLAFVSRIATTRAAEVDNDIINVASANVEANGVLKIKAGKSNTASLNLNGNKIYTVSLKVPIAAKHLFDKEGAANVYSEYTRLSEIYFTPKLHKTAAVGNTIPVHFNDSTEIYQSAMGSLVAAKVQYNKTLDLNTLVEGCAFTDPATHEIMTLEQMKGYGFEVSYTLATRAYTTTSADGANQQEFAKISGATFTPGSPSGNSFAAANQAAIGKQPIVHVFLTDTKNKQLVDQRYFKVLITREDPTPLSYSITPSKELELGCGNYTWNVTWDEMTKQVLSQFPGNGISKEDFFNRYGAHASGIEVKVDGVVNSALAANVTDNVTLDNTGASIPVMTAV